MPKLAALRRKPINTLWGSIYPSSGEYAAMSTSSTRIDGKRCLIPLRSSNSIPRVVCGLHPPIRHQSVDIGLTRAEPQIPHAVKIDRRGITIDCYQRFELPIDLMPVLRHADVLGDGKQLSDAATGTRAGREFVGRIGFGYDRVTRMSRQCQVIDGRGTHHAAADDHDFRHFPLTSIAIPPELHEEPNPAGTEYAPMPLFADD